MKELSLNGIWKMKGAGYECDGTIPGSVYSFLLDKGLMEDPFFRPNELEEQKLLDNEFVFSRTFFIDLAEDAVILHCDGGNGKILNYLSATFKYPNDFGTLTYASQLLQAEAMRYGVEHLRRNRGRCMGALYWQLNDIWPTASWASIDYYGRYKALQYVAKRFFAPVMISCFETVEQTTRPMLILEHKLHDYETKARLCVTNVSNPFICSLLNPNFSAISRLVYPCSFNFTTSDSYSLMC